MALSSVWNRIQHCLSGDLLKGLGKGEGRVCQTLIDSVGLLGAAIKKREILAPKDPRMQCTGHSRGDLWISARPIPIGKSKSSSHIHTALQWTGWG